MREKILLRALFDESAQRQKMSVGSLLQRYAPCAMRGAPCKIQQQGGMRVICVMLLRYRLAGSSRIEERARRRDAWRFAFFTRQMLSLSSRFFFFSPPFAAAA